MERFADNIKNSIKKFDTVKQFTENKCEYCKQPSVNYVTKCRHFYHINCFTHVYFYLQSCVACNTKISIPGLPHLTENECFRCKIKTNLIKCDDCRLSYCFICLQNSNIKVCCQGSLKNLDYLFVECPGCNYPRSYSDIFPMRCKGHGLLCKKCYNLSVAARKCVLGCDLQFPGAIYCDCEACTKRDFKYFDEFVCPNNCTVCDPCSRQYNLHRRNQEKSCVYCGYRLINKQEKWL
jgi:hypothetical protein